jgi:hypothetical protein
MPSGRRGNTHSGAGHRAVAVRASGVSRSGRGVGDDGESDVGRAAPPTSPGSAGSVDPRSAPDGVSAAAGRRAAPSRWFGRAAAGMCRAAVRTVYPIGLPHDPQHPLHAAHTRRHNPTEKRKMFAPVSLPTTDQVEHAAVRILARTGTDTVTGLLTQHGNRGGRCGYCRSPTPWPCDLARLCQAALLLLHPVRPVSNDSRATWPGSRSARSLLKHPR